MDDTKAQVVARDDDRIRAMIAIDIDRLRDLLSPQLIYTHAAGFSEDREAHLATLDSRAVRYLRFERRIEKQLLLETTCVLHGTADVDVLAGEKPASVSVRFTSVWQYQDGAWCMIAWSAVNL